MAKFINDSISPARSLAWKASILIISVLRFCTQARTTSWTKHEAAIRPKRIILHVHACACARACLHYLCTHLFLSRICILSRASRQQLALLQVATRNSKTRMQLRSQRQAMEPSLRTSAVTSELLLRAEASRSSAASWTLAAIGDSQTSRLALMSSATSRHYTSACTCKICLFANLVSHACEAFSQGCRLWGFHWHLRSLTRKL